MLNNLPNPIERPFLTVPETASILGISEYALYKRCRFDEFPHIRFGRTVRIPTQKVYALAGFPEMEDVGTLSPRPSRVDSILRELR